MPHVLIVHEVDDYPAWKAIFDEAAGLRKRAGELSYSLLRHQNDASNVVHFSSWNSLEAARSFFESPELVAIRAQAGVRSPQFHYLETIESAVL